MSKYSLLVICWPIYVFNSGPTINSQIHRIGNLQGINTAIVAVGGGIDPLNVVASMNKIIRNAIGTIIESLTAFRSADNLDIQGEASKITP